MYRFFSRKWGKRLLPILALVMGCWFALQTYEVLGGVEAVQTTYGPRATFVLLLLFLIPPLPSEPIAAAIATLQGFPVAVALYWCGLIIRSTMEYAGARAFVPDPSLVDHKAHLPERLRNLPIDHPVFLISGRWMPLGNHIVSVVAGVGRVSVGRFVVAAAIGTLPLAIIVPSIATGVVWFHG